MEAIKISLSDSERNELEKASDSLGMPAEDFIRLSVKKLFKGLPSPASEGDFADNPFHPEEISKCNLEIEYKIRNNQPA